jgi:hypothetical protein
MKDTDSAFPVYEEASPCTDYVLTSPGMTLKKYAAIRLKVPRSGYPEIDAMIRESRRAEFAGQAMAGLLAWENAKVFPDEESKVAFAVAEAMLAEWEKEAGK